MCNAHIYLPGGKLWDLGYNGIVELGFKVTKDKGKVIVEFERDDLRVLLNGIAELETKGLEFKMRIYWDDIDGYTDFQSRNFNKCNC